MPNTHTHIVIAVFDEESDTFAANMVLARGRDETGLCSGDIACEIAVCEGTTGARVDDGERVLIVRGDGGEDGDAG